MANLALVSAAPSYAVRPDYNPEQGGTANPVVLWPSRGGGAHVREKNYIPIVSPVNIAAGGGLTTGKPVFG